jgi:purine-binding chemotaxis protein CheW
MEQMEQIDSDEMLETEDTQNGKYLTFVIGSEEYGIEIRHVTEIIGIQSITDLPDMPSFVKGVINLRGKVIPVIDIRLRFSMQEREYDERTCIVVVKVNATSVGLIVDSVSEVLDIATENVEPPPQVHKGEGSRFLQGLGKVNGDVKILLEVQKLLFEEELEAISESISA